MTFTGRIAELPLGQEGLTGNKNLSQVRPTELLLANNIDYSSGTISKLRGSVKYNSTAITGTPSILGGAEYYPSDGVQRQVILGDDGKLYKDTDTTFGVTLKTGLTNPTVPPHFVEAGAEVAANNKKLFIFTEKNVVQVLSGDGATTSDLTTPPADWTGSTQPTFGVHHEGRLWGGGNSNDPHRVYSSLTTNHEDFTGAGSASFPVYPGEGDKLVAGISFKGLLILFKYPKGIYAINTADSDTNKWRVTRLSQSIGTLNATTVVQVVEDVVFLDKDGSVNSLASTSEFGDIKSANVSQFSKMDEYARDNFSRSNLTNAQGIYYPAKSQVQFAVPDLGSTTNNLIMTMDLSEQRPRFNVSDKDTPISLWTWTDSTGVKTPMSGDASGFVWKLDQSVYTVDGAGYNSVFQIPYLDLSHIDPALSVVNKHGKFLELVVEPAGNWTVSADIYWDDTLVETVQFNMGSAGATLGSFVLDTDILADTAVGNKKRRITGSGRRISVAIRNSAAGESFSIAKMLLHYTVGDNRL